MSKSLKTTLTSLAALSLTPPAAETIDTVLVVEVRQIADMVCYVDKREAAWRFIEPGRPLYDVSSTDDRDQVITPTPLQIQTTLASSVQIVTPHGLPIFSDPTSTAYLTT